MPCLQEIEKDAVKRARLMDSLSSSFPSSALSKALHMNWDENIDPLSSSCYASIRLDKFSDEDTSYDDELTSLAWLQDANLLKNITPAEQCLSPLPIRNSAIASNAISANVPYDPLRHVKHKPPYSFSCLIFMAIENSLSKRLPVKGIYDWIVRSYPYFQTAPDGWKNSVRHNLSLNKCFKKVERDHRQGLGKGSSWCIDPKHRPNLLQALRRTPYHPFQQLQMVSSASGTSQTDDQTDELKITDEDMKQQTNKGKLPPREIFPFLSKHLDQVNNSGDTSSDTENSDVMKPFSLKWESHVSNYSLIKQKLSSCSNVDDLVCTSYPSADHTYSIPKDVLEEVLASSDKSSSVDEGLDCGSESEEDDVAEDDIGSDNINVANNDTQSIARSVSVGSDSLDITTEMVQTEETLSAVEEKNTREVHLETDDQQKRNFFAAMALIEMSSSVPQNLLPTKVSKRRRVLPAKLKDASESVKKLSGRRARVSERREKASEDSTTVFPIDNKVSRKRRRLTGDNGDDAVNQQDSNKRPKRIQKRLLPINSSLWGVRRKLPDTDSNLESPPKKQITVKKQATVKKTVVTEKQAVTRRRRK